MSWMLPLLKANVENSSIAYFQNNILLMAMNTKMFANHCENDELDVSKHYNLAYTQLWSLLPCFCKNASDVPVIFPVSFMRIFYELFVVTSKSGKNCNFD